MTISFHRWFPRAVSPTLFAGIALAFALPFATVSCNGGAVRTTGLQLATYSVPDAHPHATTDDGDSLAAAIEHRESFWALLTLASALAGLACGVAGRRGEAKAAVAGLGGVVAMSIASFDFLGPDVHYEIGFVLVSLGFPVLVVWHAALAVARRRRARRGPEPSSART